jgi:hypothetical protein
LFKPSHQGSLWAFRADVKGKPKAWVGEEMVSALPSTATVGGVETAGGVETVAEEAMAWGGEAADRMISFPIQLGDQVRLFKVLNIVGVVLVLTVPPTVHRPPLTAYYNHPQP